MKIKVCLKYFVNDFGLRVMLHIGEVGRVYTKLRLTRVSDEFRGEIHPRFKSYV